MNLRLRLILAFSLMITIFIISIYFLSHTLLLNGFNQIEDQNTQKTISRFKEIINEELSNLSVTSVGWSSWDDSFNYSKDPIKNKSYVKQNYEIETIFDSKFSRVMFYNIKNNLLFSKDYVEDQKIILETETSETTAFTREVLMSYSEQKHPGILTGIFIYNQKASFFSLNPVLDSEGKSQHNGYLVFFRDINKEFLTKLSRMMNLQISSQVKLNSENPVHQKEFFNVQEKSLAQIYFKNFNKKHSVLFTFEIPRNIYTFGDKIFTRYFLILLIFVAILCIVTYKIFDHIVMGRILKLSTDLNAISGNKKDLHRVEEQGEDEIGKLSKNINQTLNTIDDDQIIITRTSKFSALGEIAASIAHEINNPITAISLQASHISKQAELNSLDPEDLKNRALKIKNNVLRIEKIIKSLRFISRDGHKDDLENTKLETIISEVNNLFIETLKHKNIQLNLEELDQTIILKCRPVQIAQVFINLINNSIDAIENLESPWIKIDSQLTDTNIIIKISDCGQGITDEIAQKLMEPFFTTKSSGKGTGLGLSITKKIIESHQGQIELQSKPHTQFILTFPKECRPSIG